MKEGRKNKSEANHISLSKYQFIRNMGKVEYYMMPKGRKEPNTEY